MACLRFFGLMALVGLSGAACSDSGGSTDTTGDASTVADASDGSAGQADSSVPPRDGATDVSVPDVADAASPDGEVAEGGAVDAGGSGRLLLADTGLYADPSTEAAGVHAYRPRFELWSDGATKRRWLSLPEGTSIDTSDMDRWVFPVGTKAWKEFTRDGIRIETRLLEKVSEGPLGWTFVAYTWNEAQTEAVAAPSGAENALGTDHDVPNQNDCFKCHAGSADMLLGVSALQLSHDTNGLSPAEREALGLTLSDLEAEGRLSEAPPDTVLSLPGDETARAALATLHVNCGTCHHPEAPTWERAELDLHLAPSTLGSVEETGAYRTAVGVPTEQIIDGADLRVLPRVPSKSALYVRMTSRDPILGMPPLATEMVDKTGAKAVADWISSLPPLADGGAADAGLDGGP